MFRDCAVYARNVAVAEHFRLRRPDNTIAAKVLNMQSVIAKSKRVAVVACLALGLTTLTGSMVPLRAAPASIYAQHDKNWVQRHPTLTGIGAGIATHHMLKVSAAHAKARGQKLNWAQRHPTLSAFGAGIGTHHIIKHTTPH